MNIKTTFVLLVLGLLSGCGTQKSYVSAPSTAKVQADVTAATQSNAQLKDLSNEERNLDVRKSNKDQIISRWEQTHPRQ